MTNACINLSTISLAPSPNMYTNLKKRSNYKCPAIKYYLCIENIEHMKCKCDFMGENIYTHKKCLLKKNMYIIYIKSYIIK